MRGLNHNHSHDLKNLFKGAALSASTRPGPLCDFYVALVEKGMRPTMARLTLVRKMAAITLTMWKKGNTQCRSYNVLSTSNGTLAFDLTHNQLTPNDYPFEITGTADVVSHTINATLRVGDFTASLDKTTATLSAGQSATFNLTFTSMNHYTSTIAVYCQSPSKSVTCSVSGSPAALSDGGTVAVQRYLCSCKNSSCIRCFL